MLDRLLSGDILDVRNGSLAVNRHIPVKEIVQTRKECRSFRGFGIGGKRLGFVSGA